MDNSVEILEDFVEDTDPNDTMVNVIERAEALLASLPERRKVTTNRRAATRPRKERSTSNNLPGPSNRATRIAQADSDCIIVIPDSEEPSGKAFTAGAASVTSSPIQSSTAEGGISCPICFDPVFQGPAASTICGHLYCYECISMEIKVRPKCPMCSRPLQASEIIQLFRN